jgi:hypothetical protein
MQPTNDPDKKRLRLSLFLSVSPTEEVELCLMRMDQAHVPYLLCSSNTKRNAVSWTLVSSHKTTATTVTSCGRQSVVPAGTF